MMDKMNEALDELKRVDHLIYVSLKYTRTVDVIVNILNRMVDAYSLIVDALIVYAKEQDKVISEPDSAVERAQLVRSIYHDDDIIADNIGLYLLLRKLLRARNVERENEYRRHVTMKTIIEGREEIVNIDIITNYYLFLREFIVHSKSIIEGTTEVIVHVQEFSSPSEPEWMRGKKEEDEDIARIDEAPLPVKTAPVRSPVKVRPVSSPPRKRSPRPKKYKIQVPKGKNPIMRPPYEHDPKYNKELRERLEKEKRDKEAGSTPRSAPQKSAKVKKVARKKAVKKKAAKKKTSKKAKGKKAVGKKPKKATKKKTAKKSAKKTKKSSKKTAKKSSKKSSKKATRKKR